MLRKVGYEIDPTTPDFYNLEYTDTDGKTQIVYGGDPEVTTTICQQLEKDSPIVAPFAFDGRSWDLGDTVSYMTDFITHVTEHGYKIAFHNINVYEGKQYHYITAIRED